MISEQKRALLYLLAKDRCVREGAIIDAGAFLGGSTTAITQGCLTESHSMISFFSMGRCITGTPTSWTI